MLNIEKLDDKLYIAKYGLPKVGDKEIIWSEIKGNPEILREAVKIQKDKFNQYDTVKGLAICDALLTDYEDVDVVAYNQLIKSIYTSTDIARIVIDGASNGGYSFLLMSLWNHNLKLTEEQKAFAVDEAMNKIGTTRNEEAIEKYSKELDEKGIKDYMTMAIELGGSINPIGAKAGSMYMYGLFSSLSTTQAHGSGPFDIRYCILRNPNWTLEEKQKLIMDFWYDAEEYDAVMEEWEWSVVNDFANYKGNPFPPFDIYDLFNDYTYDMLLEFYGDKETTDRIWSDMEFCKQMHKLRPQQWELELKTQKVLA